MKEPTTQQITNVLNGFAPKKENLLIPILQKIQETFGYVPPNSLKPISQHTHIAQSKVFGVLTFYAQFSMTRRGKYILHLCRGTACHVKGAQNIINHIKSFLKIQDGQTTPDYRFTLETVACLGTCFLAPALMVNQEYYGNLNEQKTEEILNSCK